jgi:hypothetical protein
MSTGTVTPTPAAATPPASVGQRIKLAFAALGRDLVAIGTDALKAIGVIQKDLSLYEPLVLATIAEMFPGVTIPTNKINSIISSSLSTSTAIANALQEEGLSPSLDQTAAIQTAVVIHSLTAKPKVANTPAPTTS